MKHERTVSRKRSSPKKALGSPRRRKSPRRKSARKPVGSAKRASVSRKRSPKRSPRRSRSKGRKVSGKRKLSGYLNFLKEERAKAGKNMSSKEIVSHGASKWRKMSVAEKAKYAK